MADVWEDDTSTLSDTATSDSDESSSGSESSDNSFDPSALPLSEQRQAVLETRLSLRRIESLLDDVESTVTHAAVDETVVQHTKSKPASFDFSEDEIAAEGAEMAYRFAVLSLPPAKLRKLRMENADTFASVVRSLFVGAPHQAKRFNVGDGDDESERDSPPSRDSDNILRYDLARQEAAAETCDEPMAKKRRMEHQAHRPGDHWTVKTSLPKMLSAMKAFRESAALGDRELSSIANASTSPKQWFFTSPIEEGIDESLKRKQKRQEKKKQKKDKRSELTSSPETNDIVPRKMLVQGTEEVVRRLAEEEEDLQRLYWEAAMEHNAARKCLREAAEHMRKYQQFIQCVTPMETEVRRRARAIQELAARQHSVVDTADRIVEDLQSERSKLKRNVS